MASNRQRTVRRSWIQIFVASGCIVTGPACSDYSVGGPSTGGQLTRVDTSLPSGAGASGTGDGPGDDAGTSGGSGAESTPPISGGLQSAAEMGDACAPGDVDFDETPDCLDGCPMDYLKTAPGVCGCGAPDGDLDGDGAHACEDMCDVDPAKLLPGLCGCGVPDSDSDEDGTMNCMDTCPFDATRTAPGACGCGAPDDLALCLRHRYSFDGTGATATDSVGDADGTIVNTTLGGDGTLTLAGLATDQYVDLPDGIISALGSSATLEVWLTWPGTGAPWQRIFDFGSSDAGAGLQGTGVTYLFITPANTINTHLRAAFTVATAAAENVVNGPTVLPFQVPLHLALVIDGPAAEMSLYHDGALVGTSPTFDNTLAALNDVNNWIGRSQFLLDEEFQGSIEEFRIYSAPRSAEQIAADVVAGPDELPEE